MSKVFFIIGCPRSGTTAIAKILDTAINAKVFVEQEPKKELCIASRDVYKKLSINAKEIIKDLKNDIIMKTTGEGYIYGDKNPNYLNFVLELFDLYNAKFIFVLRDAREVVRSILNSFEHRRGSFFGLAEDGCSSKKDKHEDWWDYSRIRPNKGDEYYDVWMKISRFEKCCWYWNQFNNEILNYSEKLGSNCTFFVNINKINTYKVKNIFEHLGLQGFDQQKIDSMISKKINSQKEFAGVNYEYPEWEFWPKGKKSIFLKHCSDLMRKFGYM